MRRRPTPLHEQDDERSRANVKGEGSVSKQGRHVRDLPPARLTEKVNESRP